MQTNEGQFVQKIFWKQTDGRTVTTDRFTNFSIHATSVRRNAVIVIFLYDTDSHLSGYWRTQQLYACMPCCIGVIIIKPRYECLRVIGGCVENWREKNGRSYISDTFELHKGNSHATNA